MRLASPLTLALAIAVVSGCAGGQTKAAATKGPTRVAISVTENGFEPEMVKVAAGQPVTLVVTRQTTKTCATELVMPDYQINQSLPLGQAVEITFTPARPGEIGYACAMDMYKGRVIAE